MSFLAPRGRLAPSLPPCRLLRVRASNLRWTAYFYLSTFVCTCVCIAARPIRAPTHLLGRAELTGPRSAWVSSRGKIEAARCGDSGPPRISLPWVCSRPKQEPPSGVSSRWTPRLRWGGGYRLTCRPAARSGIKRQVERGSIPWLEWGGNMEVNKLENSNCGGYSWFHIPTFSLQRMLACSLHYIIWISRFVIKLRPFGGNSP